MANDNVFQSADIKSHELFYKIPQIFSYKPYEKLSIRAEKLYGVLLWKISNPNAKSDNIGVYCHATIDELEILLKCSNRLAIQTKKELSDFGLIVEKRQYNGPNKIYLRKLDKGDVSDVLPHDEKSSLKVTKSHNVNDEKSSLKVTKSHSIKNIKKYKEYKEIDSTAVGGAVAENSSLIRETEQEPDGQQHQQSIFDEIQENFGRVLWPIEIETLNHLLAENNIELVREALKRAVLNGKPSINYMDGILRSWRMKNITTPLEAQAEIDNAKNKTGNSNPYMSDDEVRSMQEKYGF